MKFKAINDKVAVKLWGPHETTTASGIVLPEVVGSRDPCQVGTVMSVGQDVEDINVGDTVVVVPRVINEVPLVEVGESIHVIPENHILAVVDSDDKDGSTEI